MKMVPVIGGETIVMTVGDDDRYSVYMCNMNE